MLDYQADFLRLLVPGVLALQRRAGLPASVVLAQAILESDWGRSLLARRNRNLFGIKAHSRANSSTVAVFSTSEYSGGRSRQEKARFASYETFEECLDDYARLLTRPRYAPARAVVANPDAFARELQRCGYATDPRYAHKLSLLIRRHNLDQYGLPDGLSPAESREALAQAGLPDDPAPVIVSDTLETT